MAADIKENGLHHPIVVKDDLLIDGRNRLEACKRAGIEPGITELNGTDPVAYIVSANINRRHMTMGQRAMALAKIYREPEKGGKGKRSQIYEGLDSKDKRRLANALSQARTVLKALPEMANLVLAGEISLNDAYVKAQQTAQRIDKLKSERSFYHGKC